MEIQSNIMESSFFGLVLEGANGGTQISVNYYFFGQISVNYYFFWPILS